MEKLPLTAYDQTKKTWPEMWEFLDQDLQDLRQSNRETPVCEIDRTNHMIRFIDIRNQGTGYRFAFWDTGTDRFVCLDGTYAWDSWDSFAADAKAQDAWNIELERYRGLCPDWVDDEQEDDIDAFYDAEEDGPIP